MSIAQTPEPPYTAVIFTSLRTDGENGYGVMSQRMVDLARRSSRDSLARRLRAKRWGSRSPIGQTTLRQQGGNG